MAIPDQAKVQMAETWRRLAEQAKGSGESNTDGD
jgi:hypothetical protein